MTAAWTPCTCGEYYCNIHQTHAYECECPVIDDWDHSPYEVTMSAPKSNQSRQASFKARMKDAGLVRVEAWVPKDKKAELLAYVEQLKEIKK